ncbi:hypothetical protein [Pseudoalteromonas luteoviolacea]|uniref:Uncharacterized protein n=1 Tax=Pseudoalteromonas luteoviolacea S4060-1 TaxID=1365257 RepID=A0A167JQT5_9GAMM|nr:hypothetical protein [Pseudoalteromonas luteoviolacea]KZN61525.1 hypothetical protein N478_05480 [Pseudoalteromonas luteoviolacea S4060-1]
MSDETRLNSTVTVAQYRKMVKDRDKIGIADLIETRFSERYLEPFHNNSAKHGFSMMAITCLMIETLESFRLGWPNSKGKSSQAFRSFFEQSKHFGELKDYHGEFYKHIRCGLLHQAETTGGWKINRKEQVLFNQKTKTINAKKFMDNVEKELKEYVKLLKEKDWDSECWELTRKKIDHICEQCELS